MNTGAAQARTTLRARLIVALCLCGSLALSGCSGGSSNASKPKTSTSATPSPSVPSATPTPAVETVPPAPAATRGEGR